MHILAAIDYSAVNTYANIGTFLLLLASVIAAAVSLHHAASFNQISAVISMERDLRGPDMQEALRFVQLSCRSSCTMTDSAWSSMS